MSRPELNLFIPIVKVDEENRLIYGRITEETPDSVNEVMDYETSKPYFRKWSAFFQNATDGKSFGNVRMQHDKTRNAGHLTDIAFVDDLRAIDVVAKINDDREWQRVLDGDYTGFSPGGRYVKRWTDEQGKKRYTAEPSEVSIVDYPMHKSATFQILKTDGSSEERPFRTIEKEAHVKPEIAGITLEKLQADNPDMAPLDMLKKYAGEEIGDVVSAAYALQSIVYLYQKEMAEGHPEAAAQVEALKNAIANLKTFIASEIMEAAPGDVINLAQGIGDLCKADATEKLSEFNQSIAESGYALIKVGAAISGSNMQKIQAIHDHATSMGASCKSAKAEETGDLEKVAAQAAETLGKVEGERDEALTKVATLTTENETLTARVKELEAEPEPGKGVTKTAAVTVTKADDGGGASDTTEKLQKVAEALDRGDSQGAGVELIKLIHEKAGRPAAQ